ncbi:flagellar hook-associated protein FlgK [Pseudomonas sp.]|uniref:flagellar hook-associated protein FlgK n=1 Tax=Pseudomonas sp. TaxID=306 RepID=UPI00272B0E2B|nr:flagellar hook-associated protein FlgK [Pseudomonas sp.]
MADLFNIGLSGLRASQTQLSVTGQNISNINTPGYSRQTAVQSARDPSFTGAGYIGNGTSIVDVQRVYNQFLTNQVRASTSINSEAMAFQSQVEELNTLLSSTATGILPGMQNFFAALQTAAEDPASIPARQLVLSEASGLAARFNTVHERLTVQNQFIGQQIGTVAQQVTRLAASVASYNDSIAKATANGAQPNDLLDARDEAVRKLSELIGVTVVPQDDNGINIFVGSGQPLVVGNKASELKAVPGRDPARVEVRLVSGGSEQGITSLVSGGEMGGLLRYRNEVLDPAVNSMGRLALTIADQFNRQLGQGLNLNGQPGSNLFQDINSPELMELRSRPLNNERQLNVEITNTSALTTSDYELTVTEAGFSVRRLSDNQPVLLNDDVPPSFDGWIPSLPAGGNVGDKFLVTPTRSGAAGIKVEMQNPKELAFASPVTLQTELNNSGTGSMTQPSLTVVPATGVGALSGLNIALVYRSVDEAGDELPTKGFTVEPDSGITVQIRNPEYRANLPETGANLKWINAPDNVAPVGQQVRLLSEGYAFEFSTAGRPADGDKFSIVHNPGGTGDNRNALRLTELQTAAVFDTKSGKGVSLLDSYGNEVQRVATLTAQARSESEASGAVLRQATNNRDSVSAVNLDEEATNLIKFEQYYNASAQVIQVARSMFDTLISSIR